MYSGYHPVPECGRCEDNKKCYAVEAAVDTATGEAVEIKHCVCTVCNFEWVE
jgi:hypothetical protein